MTHVLMSSWQLGVPEPPAYNVGQPLDIGMYIRAGQLCLSDRCNRFFSFLPGENVLHVRDADTHNKIYHALELQFGKRYPWYDHTSFSFSLL